MTRINLLLEIRPYIPGVGPTTIRLSSASNGDSAGTQLDGYEWHPLLTSGPTYSFVYTSDENGLLTTPTTDLGSVQFRMAEFYDNEIWSTYDWNNAQCRMWIGQVGQSFTEYRKLFEATASGLERSGVTASLKLRALASRLDKPLLDNKYAGTGGAEGATTMKGKTKPMALGNCLSVEPVVVDAALWIFQVHGYGPVQDIVQVYDFAQPVGDLVASVQTYEELAALEMEPGQWAKCNPLGMFRLGGSTDKKISADVLGGVFYSQFPDTVADIVPTILRRAGFAPSQIGSFAALANKGWSFYSTEDITIGDLCSKAVLDAGGYLFNDNEGRWQVGNAFAPKPAKPLLADGSAEPSVGSIVERNVADPLWQFEVGYDPCWAVHSTSDISPKLLELAGTINEQAEALDEVRDLADLAKAQSDAAQLEITNMVSDGILDRSEKIDLIADLETAAAQRSELASEIGQYQAATQWAAYQTAHNALVGYVTALAPSIYDTSVSTPVDRATFRARWAAYYESYQAVLNAMVGDARKVAIWENISGIGKAEDNATVGAPAGTEVAGMPAEVLLDNVQTIDNNLTELGLEVDQIGDKVEVIDTDLEDAKAQITDLFTTYGSTASAAASAQQSEAAKLASQQARDASVTAQQNAQLASSNAAQARDQAVTASASANESKVLAVQAETAAQRAAGTLMPSSFEFGDEYWFVFESSAGSGYAAVFNGQHYRGIEIQPQGYGMFRNRYPLQVMPGNRVRVKVRVGNWSASSPNPRSYIRFTYYDGQSNRIIFHDAPSLALSIPEATYEHVAEADVPEGVTEVFAECYASPGGFAGGYDTFHTILWWGIEFRDVTSEYRALGHANASNQSAQTAAAHADNAGQSASASNLAKIDAETARSQSQVFRDEAVTARNTATDAASTATTQQQLATQARNDAQGHANASFNHSQTSQSAADLSGSRASAADTSRIQAEAANAQAQGAAGAAQSSAVAADGHRSSASSAATLSATYRDQSQNSFKNAVLVGGNLDFSQGLEGWTQAVEGIVAADIPPAGVVGGGWGTGRNYWQVNNGEQQSIYSRKSFEVDTSRVYELKVDFGAWLPSGSGQSDIYIGFIGLDANGNYLDHGNFGTYRYSLAVAEIVQAGTLIQNRRVLVTGEGNDSWTKFPPGTKRIRLMALVNHAPGTRTLGNPTSYVSGFEIADVTDRENAKSSALASAASATVADGHRASAASQANLASTFANDAGKTVASIFPSDFSKIDAYFCALDPTESLFDPVKPPIYNVTFINDPAAPGEGRLLRTIPNIVPGAGLVTYGFLPRTPGKSFRLTLRGRLAAYPSGGRTARVTLGAALYDANGWLLTWQQLKYYDGNQYTAWTNFTHEIDFIPESVGGVPVAYWRPYASIGQLTDWSNSDGVYDFSRFIVEEITAVKASEAAATASQNSATAADAHRASAASDASLAASFRGQAGDFATNAQQNAVAAQGHRAAAESAAGASSGSATVADGHRAAAATQANLSATYSRDALVSASEVFPSTFDRESEFFTSITGSEITAQRFDEAYPGVCSYPVRTDLGKVLRIGNVPAGWQYLHLHTRKRISRASQRRYRITAKVHVLSDAPLGRTRVVATCYGLKQDFATITYDGVSYAASPGGIPQLVDATTANGIFEVGIDFWSGPTSSDTVWIVPGIYVVGYDGVATVGNIGIIDIISLKVEDVTDSIRATTQANIATTQATAADASRSVAEQAANLSAQYRDQAQGHANTASTQAGIATNQQSIATAAAAAARTTSNLVARINTGSINPNPGLIEWTAGVGWPEYWQAWAGGPADRIVEATGDLTARFYADNDHQLGMVQYATGDLIRITPGKYVIDVEASISSGTTQGAGVLIFWLNGETVIAGEQLPLNATPDIAGVTATWWDVGVIKRFRKVVTAPAGTNRAYVYAMANWEGFGYGMPWKHINFHYVALKPAGIADAGFSQLESSVTTLQGAVADINGAAAFTETVVAATGSNPAVMRLKAGKNGSAIGFAADQILLQNYQNGQIVEVAKFQNGVATLNNALARRLRVAPRTDSTIFLPVQLQPMRMLVSDGETKSYSPGLTFGALPERITPDISGLPAPAQGERYDVRALNVTPTGFTARVKLITAGAATTQTTGGFTNTGGTPQFRGTKPTAADASNGFYSFSIEGWAELVSAEPSPGGSAWFADYYATGDIYKIVNGNATVIGSYNQYFSIYQEGILPTQAGVTIEVTISHGDSIGANGQYHLGLHPTTGGIYSATASYTTQTSTNETAVSGAIPWLVYPPLPNE